jgi:hypothetical protein
VVIWGGCSDASQGRTKGGFRVNQFLAMAFAALLSIFKVPVVNVAAATPKLQAAHDGIAAVSAVVQALPDGNTKTAALIALNDAATVVGTAIVVGHTVEASAAPAASGASPNS